MICWNDLLGIHWLSGNVLRGDPADSGFCSISAPACTIAIRTVQLTHTCRVEDKTDSGVLGKGNSIQMGGICVHLSQELGTSAVSARS